MRLFPYLAVLLFATAAWGQPPADLGRQLREGGYVLYMRHTSTDFGQDDSKMTSYEDCANQRNLTDKGRAEAREIGHHVKRLAEGEIAVVRPEGGARFTVVARIRPEDWSGLPGDVDPAS